MKPRRTMAISAEELKIREELGQLAEEGKVIPSPTLIMFTGETQAHVETLAAELGMTAEDVVAYALQELKIAVDTKAGRIKPDAAEPEPKPEPRREPPPLDHTSFKPW